MRDLDARGNVEAAVCLDEQIDLVTDRLSDGGNAAQSLAQILIGDLQIAFAKRVPFHGGDTALHGNARLFGKFLRFPRAREPTVDVDAALLVDLSAEQLINGNAKTLAENVPKCHFHGGKCAHQNCTAAPVGVAVNIVIVLFDLCGILSDKIVSDVLDRAHQSLFLVFQCALANAGDSFVGVDLHKHPIGAKAIHHKAFDIGNFHSRLLFSLLLSL